MCFWMCPVSQQIQNKSYKRNRRDDITSTFRRFGFIKTNTSNGHDLNLN